MIALALTILLGIVIPWGPQMLQAGVFALSLLQLFAAPLSLENFAAGLALYTIGALALDRYLPRISYGLRLLFCALWVVAGANFMLQSTTWSWPLNVAIGGFLGGCLGGRVNFGSPRVLLTYLEMEAGALSDGVARLASRILAPRRPLWSTPTPEPEPRPGPAPDRARRAPSRPAATPPPPPPPPDPNDPWAVLGVPHNASREHIRRAYLERMRQYHPDRVANLGPELRALAEEKAKQINRAYETLRGRRTDT